MQSLDLIERVICEIGVKSTSVSSIRLHTRADNEPIRNSAVVSFIFNHGNYSKSVTSALKKVGLYTEDFIEIYESESAPPIVIQSDDFYSYPIPANVHKISINFLRDQNINQHKLKQLLKEKTFYGFDGALQRHIQANTIQIFFGSNQVPITAATPSVRSVLVKDNLPYLIDKDDVPGVRFVYLDENGVLTDKKVSIDAYLTEDIRNSLLRFKHKPKSGLLVQSLLPSNFFVSENPFLNWSELVDQIRNLAESSLGFHLSSQVKRLESRISGLTQRSRVSYFGADLGVEPRNEVETVILFERMAGLSSHKLPGGMRVKVLDYSPKDVDAICEFTPSAHTPTTIKPVEFEYSLKSFFEHGHDPRQVELIICYNSDGIQFPFQSNGATYTLNRDKPVPQLRSLALGVSVHCLILKEILMANP